MQIASDRDRVPRARRPRRRGGGEVAGEKEPHQASRKNKTKKKKTTTNQRKRRKKKKKRSERRRRRRRRDQEKNQTTKEQRERTSPRERARVEGDSPHCDCYTQGQNVSPVCAVSCRSATKPERLSSYRSFLSSQQRSNRLHNLPPAPLVHWPPYIYNTPPPLALLLLNWTERDRRGDYQRDDAHSLSVSAVYEKCSTRWSKEEKERETKLRWTAYRNIRRHRMTDNGRLHCPDILISDKNVKRFY